MEEEQPQYIVVDVRSLSCIYLRVLDNFMAIQLNIPFKSVYRLCEANAHVYHLVSIKNYAIISIRSWVFVPKALLKCGQATYVRLICL